MCQCSSNSCGCSVEVDLIVGDRGPQGLTGPKGADGFLFNPDAADVTFNADPIGTLSTVEAALLYLLYTEPSALLSISITGHDVNNLEKGTTIAGGAINLSYTVTQTSKEITSKSISPNIGGLTDLIAVVSDSNGATTDRTYTLSVSDGQSTVTKTASLIFKDRIFFGVSSLTSLSAGQVTALSSELRTSKPSSMTFNPSVISGGSYIWIAMPATSPYQVSKFEFGATTVGFITTPITLTVNGQSVSYLLYRSPEKLNSTSVEIGIS